MSRSHCKTCGCWSGGAQTLPRPKGAKEVLFYFLQSSIDAEGFRSLRENEPVEFFVETSEDGRTKAVNVTGPDGAPPQVSDPRYSIKSSKLHRALAQLPRIRPALSFPDAQAVESRLSSGRAFVCIAPSCKRCRL